MRVPVILHRNNARDAYFSPEPPITPTHYHVTDVSQQTDQKTGISSPICVRRTPSGPQLIAYKPTDAPVEPVPRPLEDSFYAQMRFDNQLNDLVAAQAKYQAKHNTNHSKLAKQEAKATAAKTQHAEAAKELNDLRETLGDTALLDHELDALSKARELGKDQYKDARTRLHKLYPPHTPASRYLILQRKLPELREKAITEGNKLIALHHELDPIITALEKEIDATADLIKLFITNPTQASNQVKHFLTEIIPSDAQTFLSKVEEFFASTVSEDAKDLLAGVLRHSHIEVMYAKEYTHPIIMGCRCFGARTPHPTLIGGIDPTVTTGGTFDITIELSEDGVPKLVIIQTARMDSGHFQPGAPAMEELMKGLVQIDPKYLANPTILTTFEGDQNQPRVEFTHPSVR